jgi:hypothetical protein
MKYKNILEEEIKNKVTQDFFQKFDCTKILGKIDFAVKIKRPANAIDFNDEYLLWAEAKQKPANIRDMLTQLVLTIGKARTFDEILPPKFLGCYDSEKIAFVPYSEFQDVFSQNDFNWNVPPSDHDTKEFKQVSGQIKKIIETDIPEKTYLFNFEKEEKELRSFIDENFIIGKSGTTKIKIDKNNFIFIYNKWIETVKPTITVNWEKKAKRGIIDGDFYLADLLSMKNKTLKEKLFVLLCDNYYAYDQFLDEDDDLKLNRAEFSDSQKAHNAFWAKYERPPKEDYWDYIIERRDLLVPSDVRERKGSFFTPKIWVELSQKYIADVLGEDWQDEYYVWDCAAGTGNLLAGLTNKNNLWVSTLDKADIDVIHERITNGANLWASQCFQFDFLKDEFIPVSKGGKLPDELYNIINDEEQRKKLVIYINPPYAEATSATTVTGTGKNKTGVTTNFKLKQEYQPKIGNASNEIFALFLTKIYDKFPFCMLAQFSKLKIVQASNFFKFRNFFLAEFKKGFVVPAKTFDNVDGVFPIGFMIWDFKNKKKIEQIVCDVYIEKPKETAKLIGKKKFNGNLSDSINKWIKVFDTQQRIIGFLENPTPDFQNNKFLCIINNEGTRHNNYYGFNENNLFEGCIYFAVRHCIEANWLNDRDQFLYPNDNWKTNEEFKNDCLAYTLFHGQNRISSKEGTNHWIPFTEAEINSRDKFESRFMTDFINGKLKQTSENTLFAETKESKKIEFSAEAQSVFAAGKELWKYYHKQPKCNVNASLYDIREHFQGRNDKGTMNNQSDNEQYMELIKALRKSSKILAEKIEPKVYEYGFLK